MGPGDGRRSIVMMLRAGHRTHPPGPFRPFRLGRASTSAAVAAPGEPQPGDSEDLGRGRGLRVESTRSLARVLDVGVGGNLKLGARQGFRVLVSASGLPVTQATSSTSGPH